MWTVCTLAVSCCGISVCRLFVINQSVDQFLARDAMLARYMLSSCVCLSVCLSHVGDLQRWLNLGSVTQTTPYDNSGTLCWCQNRGEIPTSTSTYHGSTSIARWQYAPGSLGAFVRRSPKFVLFVGFGPPKTVNHSQRGRQIEVGVGSNRRFSTNVSLHPRNGARQGHSYMYYGRLIGTRMRSNEWRYLQWPWWLLTTPNDPNCDISYHLSYFCSGWRQRVQLGR